MTAVEAEGWVTGAVYLASGWHRRTQMHKARRYLHLWEAESVGTEPVHFWRLLSFFFFPGRKSVAPLCYSRHVHTQMTYLLKCQLRELCFRGLSSPLLDVCVSSSSAGCSFALISPSPCSPPSPGLTFLSSLCLSVPLPTPGETFLGVSAEAPASAVQARTSRLSAGDRLQDPV